MAADEEPQPVVNNLTPEQVEECVLQFFSDCGGGIALPRTIYDIQTGTREWGGVTEEQINTAVASLVANGQLLQRAADGAVTQDPQYITPEEG